MRRRCHGSVSWNCQRPVPNRGKTHGISLVSYHAPAVRMRGGRVAPAGRAGLEYADMGHVAGMGGDRADPVRCAAHANTRGALPTRPLSRRPQPVVSLDAVLQSDTDGAAARLRSATGSKWLLGVG